MFAHILARFHFAVISGNLIAQSAGSHGGIGGGIQILESQLQALLPFPVPLTPTRAPQRTSLQAKVGIIQPFKLEDKNNYEYKI